MLNVKCLWWKLSSKEKPYNSKHKQDFRKVIFNSSRHYPVQQNPQFNPMVQSSDSQETCMFKPTFVFIKGYDNSWSWKFWMSKFTSLPATSKELMKLCTKEASIFLDLQCNGFTIQFLVMFQFHGLVLSAACWKHNSH